MMDTRIRIERLQNGYNVCITDPKIVAENEKRDSSGKCCSPYRNPDVSYAFTTSQEVVEFLERNIDKALPADPYTASFDAAVKEMEDD